ncbi:G-patch domain-containing protein [Plectosphaerella plurivora]|uniref:G-patch domain-containing protein n=1 Tax=Plectosphaerella plurivora TaxID=936078 RepID=A0A9P9A962_9PEZI|nr:G-patch domain-containing protein [Plectosphaerella plurivora]
MSDDDDYMSMSFDQPEEKPLSSLQRRQQQKREAEIRGRPKSKAERAAEEVAAREAALSTSLLEEAAAKKNKGLAMMARMGFKAGSTLGAEGNKDARREPIGISMKEDRGGIGMENEKRRRLREAFGDADDDAAAKKRKVEEPGEYRDRMARERERERQERMVYSAQKVAEGMQEEADQQTTDGLEKSTAGGEETKAADGVKKQRNISSRPLKSINVLWRTLARQREEKERDHRMRYDLEQSLSRLPTYDDKDEDEDDKRALGKKKTTYVAAEDLDEEDPELDEFEALEPDEKLRRIVTFMRDQWNYCFWCKFKYPDDSMDGCSGLTEEDHD